MSVPVVKTASADGTTASVTATLLKIELLAPDVSGEAEPIRDALQQILDALGLDITQPLGVIELGPMAASVVAPAGGIRCGTDNNNPVELSKTNSGPAIPGQTFDYEIRVGNVGTCTLLNVAVTDDLSGPAGSTITATDPTATNVGTPTAAGPGLERTRITWADIGPIAPNASRTLKITVRVPLSATVGQRYEDTVSVWPVALGLAFPAGERTAPPH